MENEKKIASKKCVQIPWKKTFNFINENLRKF